MEDSKLRQSQRKQLFGFTRSRRIENLFPKSFAIGERDLDATPSGRHLVLLIHGMRSHGRKMRQTIRALDAAIENTNEANKTTFRAVRYQRVGLLRAIQILGSKSLPAEASTLRKDINDLMEQYDVKRVSIIAYSLGTYLVTRLLEEDDAIKFHHVIFCGSVANRSFPWGDYQARISTIFNDCGLKDKTVRVAECWAQFRGFLGFKRDFGESGYRGFLHFAEHREYEDINHTDFFTDKFSIYEWTKVLLH